MVLREVEREAQRSQVREQRNHCSKHFQPDREHVAQLPLQAPLRSLSPPWNTRSSYTMPSSNRPSADLSGKKPSHQIAHGHQVAHRHAWAAELATRSLHLFFCSV